MDGEARVRHALGRIAAEVKVTYGYAAGYGMTTGNRGADFLARLDLLRDWAALGLRKQGREAEDCLRMVVEDVPGLVGSAEAAGLSPDFGGSAVHIKLDMIESYAREGLGTLEPEQSPMGPAA